MAKRSNTKEKEEMRIGDGIFTVADVARILRIPYRRANYWFNSYIKLKLEKSSNYKYYFKVDNTIGVNFFMIIELYAFQKMREHKVSLYTIIKTHTYLKSVFNNPYPFSEAKLVLAGREILIDMLGQIVTADESRQTILDEIVLPLSERISFSRDGVAYRFYPLGTSNSVVVNRHHQFGQPIIEGTNVKASTIYNYYLGGEDIETIARMYSLSASQVNDAIAFSKAA
jgi:uncharacterized protein (DUF433 family)